MANSHLQNNNAFFESVILSASKAPKSKRSKGFLRFVEQFYKFAPAGELKIFSMEELTAMAESLFTFMENYQKGETKIRVYNPEKKADGWEGPYTVIEIINNDMPFIVDSVTEEINRHGLKIFGVLHPVLDVKRDDKGKLLNVFPLESVGESSSAESVIHIQVSYLEEGKKLKKLEKDLLHVFKAVRLAVTDWHDILRKANLVTTEFSAAAEMLSARHIGEKKQSFLAQADEIKEFFEWLKNNNFVFLGYVEYDFKGKNKTPALLRGSELGIFKLADPEILPIGIGVKGEKLVVSDRLDNVLEITKANKKSLIHRPVHMDYVGIKRFNESGEVVGEHRFLGLFTSMVYYQSARNIPIIRKKIDYVRKKSGFAPSSHSGKALTAILEDFPRDEIFQVDADKLFDTVMGIEMLSVRPRIKLFLRKDHFERFISCIIFLPRETMNTELRYKMEQILCTELQGTVSNHYTQITDSPLARLQIIIKTTPGKVPNYITQKIEEKLAKVARKWTDNLMEELTNRLGAKEAEQVFDLYKNAFSLSYQNRFSAEDAYYDILQIENVIKTGKISFDIYESSEGNFETFEFKVYSPEKHVSLSKIMPLLANMGLDVLDEHTYQAVPIHFEKTMWIHRFRFKVGGIKKPKLKEIKDNFETAIEKIWLGEIQDDGLNRLILLAGLKWRDSVLLRAYSKYLQQSGFSYSQNYIQEALSTHLPLVNQIIELFYIRFDPKFSEDREEATKKINTKIEKALSAVTNLSEDRVIRGYIDLIQATLRTNFFQNNDKFEPKDYISFKFSSEKISWLPQPRPYAEIFVYSPRFEGIHLRGGRVARGGLRWSDRREDFRTEVLGLMKAQMAKNSVIIPVGSKGGFVVKKNTQGLSREEIMQEGVECYKDFLRGILDLTDNLVSGKVKPPKDVVRQDEDDPYLVVAADKGTATFSDYANSVAQEYGFWLGDAFASGGSAGYDHKKMGITARGAWICVVRHFRDMGVDIDKEDFTVIGIGDMSGDVFGNGMLLSKHIRLCAAFNHMHIFIDPNPNAAESFKERKRMFDLPRSSWTDYNKKLISKGGGVFERSAKSIKITDEMKKVFKIEKDILTPDELIKALLVAPVDLIWNGGIGTYVKSKLETNEEVGDRANDNVRVNGSQLKAKIVGEGGNLGFTQLGRIEYSKTGGQMNTDAIDNSAGVDCSDHEVNIKIALGKAVEKKKLGIKARNEILVNMTDEVAELVLMDNILQTQAITYAQLQGNSLLETQSRLINALEKEGNLDRAIEFLPDDEEIAKRHAAGTGLTRPEISVVMAYSKLKLYECLLASDLPDEDYYEQDLIRYFPVQLQTNFLQEIKTHPLRREIIATAVTNSIINRIGGSMFYQIQEDSGLSEQEVARAYTVAREVFELRALWNEISSIKNIAPEVQKELFLEIQAVVERTSLWFLRNLPHPIKVSQAINDYAAGIKEIANKLGKIVSVSQKDIFDTKFKSLKSTNIPESIAKTIAGLDLVASACDIVQVAHITKLPVDLVGKIYFEVGSKLHLSWMREVLKRISPHSYWQRISAKTLVDDIYDEQKRLTSEVIKYLGKDKKSDTAAIEKWVAYNELKISRFEDFIEDIKAQDEPDFSMVVVAIRKVKDIYVVEERV